MIELKFTAEKLDGQVIGGVIAADTFSTAKQKAGLIATQNNFRIKSLEKKCSFVYKAQRGMEKTVKGEQKAFSKQEVIEALTLLGYRVISVNKKTFDIPRKPSTSDILMFVKVCADMLEEKMPYGEILSFLIQDTRNKTLKDTLKVISKDLKQGLDSEEVFMKHKNVFGFFTAYMLGLASKSGNMAEIYKATAKFLERRHEFKRNLRSALITPLITLLLLNAAVVWYVIYIFPATAQLFSTLNVKLPAMTQFTLDLATILQNNIYLLIVLVALPIIAGFIVYKNPKGRVWFDKQLLRLPFVGDILHKTYIEIFCRIFYTLYSGSAVSVAPIKIAAEALGNKYIEERIKTVALPIMMKKGIGISDALVATGVFPETAISKFRQGEETGNIKKSALQLANYYESDTVYRLKNFIEWVQIGIAVYILIVMIFLTLVSAETAVVNPMQPGVLDKTIK
ncbi:MAG: type II secretion system F family protein [Ignavibacteriaceae bacterium]|nr:type II secretion system F family protein [Ignavibacteriaceae bacterium]